MSLVVEFESGREMGAYIGVLQLLWTRRRYANCIP
jgi:hypothetical protein